jgi:hypothetical protein
MTGEAAPAGGLPVGELNEVSVDFLILADRAEAVNGKLYLMGGGWDRLAIADFAKPVTLSFAVGVLVPWNATNQEHQLDLTIEDFDGRPTGFHTGVRFTAGRSPSAIPGQSQRIMIAIPAVAHAFPAAGKYTLQATINQVVRKRVEFYIVPAPPRPSHG